MADFTSRAWKRRKEKAHHPLEPVADKLYSHLRTSAHHILTPSLLCAPHMPLQVQCDSSQLLSCTKQSWWVAGRTRNQAIWHETSQPVGHFLSVGVLWHQVHVLRFS